MTKTQFLNQIEVIQRRYFGGADDPTALADSNELERDFDEIARIVNNGDNNEAKITQLQNMLLNLYDNTH